MLSEVFWSFVISSCLTCTIGTVRMLYKSKCKSVDFCCMKIVRDVEQEQKVDALEMQRSLEPAH